MSTKELTLNLINNLDESQLQQVFNYIKFLIAESNGLLNVYDVLMPNKETVDAIEEVEKMIKNGNGQGFERSTDDFMMMNYI